MRSTELNVYKKRLLKLRDRLQGNVDSLVDGSLGSESSHGTGDEADAGNENFDQLLTVSLAHGEEETLELIHAALKRIDDRSYGICIGSGAKIPKARLNALPYTPYCVEYASQLENDANLRL